MFTLTAQMEQRHEDFLWREYEKTLFADEEYEEQEEIAFPFAVIDKGTGEELDAFKTEDDAMSAIFLFYKVECPECDYGVVDLREE